MFQQYSRRQFIQKYFYGGLAIWIFVFTACRSKEKSPPPEPEGEAVNACDDLSGLGKADLQARETFGYVKESPVPDSQCNNCNLWLPDEVNKDCGKCLLFKGPVYAEGYCTSWAPQL